MKDRRAMLSDFNTFVDRFLKAFFEFGDSNCLSVDEALEKAKFDLEEESLSDQEIFEKCAVVSSAVTGKPEAKGDDPQNVYTYVGESFANLGEMGYGKILMGHFTRSLKPLIDYAKAQKERLDPVMEERDGSVKERIFLANRIQEKDVLIAKLRAALEPNPRQIMAESLHNNLKENGYQIIKKPDPEIMGEG